MEKLDIIYNKKHRVTQGIQVTLYYSLYSKLISNKVCSLCFLDFLIKLTTTKNNTRNKLGSFLLVLTTIKKKDKQILYIITYEPNFILNQKECALNATVSGSNQGKQNFPNLETKDWRQMNKVWDNQLPILNCFRKYLPPDIILTENYLKSQPSFNRIFVRQAEEFHNLFSSALNSSLMLTGVISTKVCLLSGFVFTEGSLLPSISLSVLFTDTENARKMIWFRCFHFSSPFRVLDNLAYSKIHHPDVLLILSVSVIQTAPIKFQQYKPKAK